MSRRPWDAALRWPGDARQGNRRSAVGPRHHSFHQRKADRPVRRRLGRHRQQRAHRLPRCAGQGGRHQPSSASASIACTSTMPPAAISRPTNCSPHTGSAASCSIPPSPARRSSASPGRSRRRPRIRGPSRISASARPRSIDVASNRRVMGPDGKVKFVRYSSTKDAKIRAEPEGRDRSVRAAAGLFQWRQRPSAFSPTTPPIRKAITARAA